MRATVIPRWSKWQGAAAVELTDCALCVSVCVHVSVCVCVCDRKGECIRAFSGVFFIFSRRMFVYFRRLMPEHTPSGTSHTVLFS